MSGELSPGAYGQEIDKSYTTANSLPYVPGGVVAATWGPIGARTLVSGLDGFLETFGPPSSTASEAKSWLGWREAFRKVGNAYLARHNSTANPAVRSTGSLRGGRSTSMTTGINGVSVVGTGNFSSVAANFPADGIDVGMYLQITSGVGSGDVGLYRIIAVPAPTQLTVTPNFPVGDTGDVFEVLDSMCATGINGATSVAATRQFTSAASVFTTWNVAVGDILEISEAAPGSTGDNGVYYITSVDLATRVTVDRDFPVGGLANLDYTIYKSKKVVNSLPAGGLPASGTGIGGTTITTVNFTDAGIANLDFVQSGVVAGDILVINDGIVTDCNGTYTIVTVAANALTVNRNFAATCVANLDYYIYPASVRLEGYYKGTRADDFTMRVKPNASTTTDWDLWVYENGVVVAKHLGTNRTDAGTDVDNVFMKLLDAGAVVANTTEPLPYGPETFISDADASVTIQGGADGINGASTGDKLTAVNLFKDPEQVRIRTLAFPGDIVDAVQARMLEIADARGDCVALLDIDAWATVDTVAEALAWITAHTQNTSSSFFSTCWAEQEVYDDWNDVAAWVPPSGFQMYVIAKSIGTGVFRAPMGWKRGILPQVTDTRISPDNDEREAMYGTTNAILNPIRTKAGKGTALWGQKTGLRAESSLNRMNNRLNLCVLKELILDGVEDEVGEPSDEILWDQIENYVIGPAEFMKGKRALADYRVRCDAGTNASAVLPSTNSSQAYAWFQFPETGEKIYIKFIVTPSGSSIEELSESLEF